MRVQIGVSALHADANPHYGTGKGATIYRFVSDQFSTFYTKVINTNARDAVHVIDGLLHHETDLAIEEHYTDTAGYTDQVFGLTHLLGFRFAPRLRDLADSKLYAIGKPSNFPKLEKLLRGQINTKIIQENYDDVPAGSLHPGRHRFGITHYGENRFLCKTKQFGYRATRNGAYRENDLHPGLPFERGAAAKNPSGVEQGGSHERIGQSDILRQTWRVARTCAPRPASTGKCAEHYHQCN